MNVGSQWRIAILFACLFLAGPGCREQPAAHMATPTPAAPPAPSPTATPLTETSSDEAITATTEADPQATPESPSLGDFRLLLPTTRGLLLVELDIQVDDQSLTTAFDQRIKAVMEEARGDDELTWDRLFDFINANPRQFGRTPVASDRSRDMIRLYDRNRNMRPDAEEVANLIFRDAGFAGPFRLVGSDAYRQFNRTQSAVFMAMDLDGNQALDQQEIDLAEESLAALDANGDGRIDFTEVVVPPASERPVDNAWSNRQASRWGDMAMDLCGFVDWTMMSYTLDDANRQGVWDSTPNVIARLDKNEDDSIDEQEARGLLEVPADIRIRLNFAGRLGSQPRIEVELSHDHSSATVRSVATNDRATVASEQFRLVATVRDLVEGMVSEQPAWTAQVRARGAETPDAVFCWLDQDQDGQVSEREICSSKLRLRALVSAQEVIQATDLPDTYLLQFGRGEAQQDALLFAHVPSRRPQVSSWPRWAESMDANQDGDISSREFLGQPDAFAQLDEDGDGFLSISELE